jgi:hypothetical protein
VKETAPQRSAGERNTATQNRRDRRHKEREIERERRAAKWKTEENKGMVVGGYI